MRLIIAILLFSLQAQGQIINASPAYRPIITVTGAGYARSITVDHTKVPTSNQTDFPILITGTYSYLADQAHGGKAITGNHGYDITFSTSAKATTADLSYEISYWDSTTGFIEAWVKIPTLHTGSDDVIYMNYGNPATTAFQGNVAGTWSNNFSAVYHLKNGTTLYLGNALTGTAATNNSTTATTGQIDGAAAFSGSSQYINLGNNFGTIGDFTLSAWVKPTDFSGFNGIIAKTASAQPKPFDWYLTASTGIPRLFLGDGSSGANVDGSSATTTGVWNYIAAVKSSTITVNHYLNGSGNGSGNAVGAPSPLANGSDNMYIGTRSDFVTMMKGSVDEVRIASVARAASWIATEYNNQNSPSTFYAIGSEL